MVLILDGNLEYVAQWPGQYPLPPLSGRATKKNNLFFDFPKLPSIIMSTKVSTVCLQKSKANKMYEVVRKFWLKKETSSQPEHE